MMVSLKNRALKLEKTVVSLALTEYHSWTRTLTEQELMRLRRNIVRIQIQEDQITPPTKSLEEMDDAGFMAFYRQSLSNYQTASELDINWQGWLPEVIKGVKQDDQ